MTSSTNLEFEIVVPDATPVIQSMRSIGYTLETAIADIIDNSIDADSTKIKVDIVWDEERSYIRIEDNGNGMNEQELVQAMKLGSKNPNELRNIKDLGRFGMGLKTAAFSIGKKLTVMTKQHEKVFLRSWNLDTITKTNNWTLLKEVEGTTSKLTGTISDISGTIVLIEDLDRIITTPVTQRKQRKFLRAIRDLEEHLQMVFHRFLSGKNPITILLNNNKLEAWDPFLMTEMATQEMMSEKVPLSGDTVFIQPYILPHHSKISKKKYKFAEGPKGWLDQQGFYIYRNKRLLVSGGWLGLFSKEETYKLARIKVDISNKSDFNWQIDIKKSTAKPPQEVLEVLKRMAEEARKVSYKVYYHRGSYFWKKDKNQESEVELDSVWDQAFKNDRSYFVLNRQNPLLKRLLGSDNITHEDLETYLFYVQEYCPSNVISFSPDFSNLERMEMKNEISEEHKTVIISLTKLLRGQSVSNDGIIGQISNLPAFSSYAKESIKILVEGS